ncbi:hypothetical protein HNQ34_000405 [Anoxybacillus tepidamans]|uniref:Uncharacterized protein n=1 Tax=Anoxybacteroides tepidamans TaxID=265948 RepID=A0A7W8IMP4_9BACL|nr:hypothetical protein [Anoxybacillus tepidamans]
MLTNLTNLGDLGIALGLMLEVIPSEIVLFYDGFFVLQGKINFVGAIVTGTIGGTVAQLFLYWMGYYGGRPFYRNTENTFSFGNGILICPKRGSLNTDRESFLQLVLFLSSCYFHTGRNFENVFNEIYIVHYFRRNPLVHLTCVSRYATRKPVVTHQ